MCNMLEGGLTPMKNLNELKDLGFHIVSHPLTGYAANQAFRELLLLGLLAATKALQDVYTVLAKEGALNDKTNLITLKDFNALVGLDTQLKLEEQLLGVNQSSQEKLHVRIRGKTKPAP